MRRSLWGVPCLFIAGAASSALPAHAELTSRLSVDQRGDAVLIGNTLAQNCADDVPAPLVGDVGACGSDQDDSGADVLWSVAESGQSAVANTSIDPSEAASISVLALPEGAAVTHARLYWSAAIGQGTRTRARLSKVAGEALDVQGTLLPTVEEDGSTFYQASADVTAFVQASGAGPYRLGGIDVGDPGGSESTSHYAAWWLAVFYSLASDPVRHLALYDGLERVADSSTSVILSGFDVPPGAVDARLSVIGYEGDGTIDGDSLRIGATEPLAPADAVGRADNFFDGSRRGLSGAALPAAGDLPEVSGAPDSLSGLDLHQVDVAAAFAVGQTSAVVQATTVGDHFFLSGLVLSLVTAAPELALSSESVVDVNGPPLRPGDELEYAVEVNNSGTGAASLVTLRAALPESVRYVPGSLQIVAESGALSLSDALDADGGELESGPAGVGEVLTVRLGAGDGASGGPLEVGETRAVRYRVSVAPGAAGSIVSQAQLSAASASGAAIGSALSDSDLAAPGVTATTITIDGCGGDVDCVAPASRCDLSVSPTLCVQCLSDADCSGLAPQCEPTHACTCRAASAVEQSCDGKDDDCNGQIDDGLAGGSCEVGVGACRVEGQLACDASGGVRCDAEPLLPQPERCSNGVDDDCDGDIDGVDADCAAGEPLAGEGSGSLTPGPAPAEPSSARTPTASLMPAPEVEPLDLNDHGSAASIGGGGSCQLQAGSTAAPGRVARAAGWLVLALGFGWARRRASRTRHPLPRSA